jgi:hypothetical protein
LDGYAAALGGQNDRRFRIEHSQVIAPQDFELFARYSILASMQATHATSDMRWAEARLGPQRVKGAYAWRRFLSLGVAAPNGSDFPVEEPTPLYGFYAAITRQDRQGNPKQGWFPDQRMTREEALKSWTLAGAHAAFEGRKSITDRDIALAAELALPHRIKHGPFQQAEISPEELQERIAQLQGAAQSAGEPQPVEGEKESPEKKKA